MFIARIEMKIRPEQHDDFRVYAISAEAHGRTLPGCHDYTFAEDVADASRVLLYEEWQCREDFEAYKASASFERAGSTLRPMLVEPPKSAYYESDDVFAACAAR